MDRMELYELKYFVGVAADENIHRASERLNVSAASLSKTVARLETELGIALFHREKRRIRLTDQGRLLQKRAIEIIKMEESARYEIAGKLGTLQIVISGPEILLAKLGTGVCKTIKEKFPMARFDFHADTDSESFKKLESGEAHLAIVSGDVPPKKGFSAKTLLDVKFQTYVGEKHPLYPFAKAGKTIPVEKALKHAFVSPDNPMLGKVGARQSLDGWRDDRFPRNVEYLTSSLKILEELVVSGSAIAYLPSYFCDSLPVEHLRISGCPYSCVQTIKLVAKNPDDTGWLSRIF